MAQGRQICQQWSVLVWRRCRRRMPPLRSTSPGVAQQHVQGTPFNACVMLHGGGMNALLWLTKHVSHAVQHFNHAIRSCHVCPCSPGQPGLLHMVPPLAVHMVPPSAVLFSPPPNAPLFPAHPTGYLWPSWSCFLKKNIWDLDESYRRMLVYTPRHACMA